MADVLAEMMLPADEVFAVRLRDVPRAAQFVFRGGALAASAAGAALGLELPSMACTSVRGGERAALWQGPDEWLVLAPAEQAAAIERDVAAALGDVPHALVGVGHRNVAVEVAGARAADVLNAGCPLDLDLAVFPVGMCTRTVLGKVQIVLWRTAPQVFYVNVWRSFYPYVRAFLTEAGMRL
jgi:sarcosine oxidase subunit gamma